MYTPKYYEITDRDKIFDLMRQYSFATLITSNPLQASHLPILVEDNHLLGHMARANSQWKSFSEEEVLVIFQGPHGYISPSWYPTSPEVPTWNYAVAHAYGKVKILDDVEQNLEHLHRLTDHFESSREAPYSLDMEFVRKLERAVVCFEIEIIRLEGKFKFSQNKGEETQSSIIQHLEESNRPDACDLAQWMARETK